MANYKSSNAIQKELEADIKNIKESLNSPATPDNMKVLFRKSLGELESKLNAIKQESGSTYKEELERQKKTGQAVGEGISLTAMAERMRKPERETVKPMTKSETDEFAEKTKLAKQKRIAKKKPVPVSDKKTIDGYDCDELVKQAIERKRKAKERAEQPKKTPATRNKEKIADVLDNVTERLKDEDITIAEVEKLIIVTKGLLKTLEQINLKLKRGK